MFKLQLKSFFRNLWMPIGMGIVFLGVLIYPLFYFPAVTAQYIRSAWTYLQVSQETVIVCFVAFLFLSYEFFSQVRQNGLEETLAAMPGGMKSYYISRAGVLALFNGVLTLCVMLLTTIGYFVVPLEPAVLGHMLLSIFFQFFCTCFVAILIGMALSLLKGRLAGYLAIVLIVLLGSEITDQVIGIMAGDGLVNLYGVYRFFSFYPPNLVYEANMHVGVSLLPWRWMLLGFWAFLSLAVVVKAMGKGKRLHWRGTALSAVCCLVAVALGVGVALPGSTFGQNRNPVGVSSESQIYYQTLTEGQRKKTADFEVQSYQLNIKIRSQMQVEATTHIKPSTQQLFYFTLYHTFKVQGVQAQDGTKLPFRQEGDYLDIKNTDGREISALTITYRGYSPTLYSNLQGVNMPGCFPYFPFPGYQWMTKNGKNSVTMLPVTMEKEAPFQVTVDAPYRVYSNLERVQENSFKGTANGVTLISGFLKETTIEGISCVYPSSLSTRQVADMASDIRKMDQIYAQAKKQNPALPDWRRNKILFYAFTNTNYKDVWMLDHILLTNPSMADTYANQLREQGYTIHVEGVREDD